MGLSRWARRDSPWSVGAPGSPPRLEQFGRGVLRNLLSKPASFGAAATAGALALSWLLTALLGGVDAIAPHWYYLPILFTAARFGAVPAFAVAIISGILAGPLSWPPSDLPPTHVFLQWSSRTAFFVVFGQLMAGLITPALPSVQRDLDSRRDYEELATATIRSEFTVVYQPIIHAATGELSAVEALVRWNHPVLGVVGPGAFMAKAEACGAIGLIDQFVLHEACQQAAVWNRVCDERGRPRIRVNVNVSGSELEFSTFSQRTLGTIENANLQPEQLCLEVTESILVDNKYGALDQLAHLNKKGVHIAVDDFGTGYSSLSAVHKYPITQVKIDRSFIQDLGDGGEAEAMCQGIVTLASGLALTTVAEGVETDLQYHAASRAGVTFVQGYLFSRPVAPREITGMLAFPRAGRTSYTLPGRSVATRAKYQAPGGSV